MCMNDTKVTKGCMLTVPGVTRIRITDYKHHHGMDRCAERDVGRAKKQSRIASINEQLFYDTMFFRYHLSSLFGYTEAN